MPATSNKIGDIVRACHLGEEKKMQKWLKSATLSDIDKLHSLPKADDDKVMGFSCTLLMFAAVNGHHRIVKLLLSHHASANIQNDQNFTALHWVSPARENMRVQLNHTRTALRAFRCRESFSHIPAAILPLCPLPRAGRRRRPLQDRQAPD